jgi:hypothetical protein
MRPVVRAKLGEDIRNVALGASSGEDWFEWEERPGPGPEPASNATGSNDEIVVQVRYMEWKAKL